MERKLIFTSLILFTLCSACSINGLPESSQVSASRQQSLLSEASSYLEAGLDISDELPSTIGDAQLLAAWIYLYNQVDVIGMGDGSQWSGKALAELLLKNHVPVVWNTENQLLSYTVRPNCADVKCSRRDEMDYPIYISPRLKSSLVNQIAGTLAHEAYHHSEPYGKVADTLYEEYWAFKVGAIISDEAWVPLFDGEETNPFCLKQWFSGNFFVVDYQMQEYPEEISSQSQSTDRVCHYQSTISSSVISNHP